MGGIEINYLDLKVNFDDGGFRFDVYMKRIIQI